MSLWLLLSLKSINKNPSNSQYYSPKAASFSGEGMPFGQPRTS